MVGADETKSPVTSYMPDLDQKCWWKKRSPSRNLFFHQDLRIMRKIFGYWRKTWWKKRFIYSKLFFHQLFWLQNLKKSGKHKTWWKKRFLYSNLYFHQLFWLEFRKIFGGIKLGEKKDCYIEIFFFTNFHVMPPKNFIT